MSDYKNTYRSFGKTYSRERSNADFLRKVELGRKRHEEQMRTAAIEAEAGNQALLQNRAYDRANPEKQKHMRTLAMNMSLLRWVPKKKEVR